MGATFGLLNTPLLCCGIFYTAMGSARGASGFLNWLLWPALSLTMAVLCLRAIGCRKADRIRLLAFLAVTVTMAICDAILGVFGHQMQSWWWLSPLPFTTHLVTRVLYPLGMITLLVQPSVAAMFTSTNSTCTTPNAP